MSKRSDELKAKIEALGPVNATAILTAIALELDGVDWGGDQLEQIGWLFNTNGIVFLSPEEADEAEMIASAATDRTFTPTEHRSTCSACGRRFIVSIDEYIEQYPNEPTTDAEAADGIDVCLECVTGDKWPEEYPNPEAAK